MSNRVDGSIETPEGHKLLIRRRLTYYHLLLPHSRVRSGEFHETPRTQGSRRLELPFSFVVAA